MLKARLTSKGQITVPVALRRQFDLEPGDEILFQIEPGGEVRVHPIKRPRLTDLHGCLPATRPFPGTAEVRREVARHVAERILKKTSRSMLTW